MIELAPRHKYGLSIRIPLMPASGTFGFGFAYRDLISLSSLGAIVTNPVSLKPRRAARGERIGVRNSCFVVHTGWPNPGLHKVIRQHREEWARLPVPIIVHLLATSVEVRQAIGLLIGVAGIGGLELGFPADVTTEEAVACASVAVEERELPVIVQVPFGRVNDLAVPLVQAGVDALTLTAPPRAVLPLGRFSASGPVVRYIRGRLYGAALFPLLLNILSQWTAELDVPIIACGGIFSAEDVLMCLNLGAAAVQIDALAWREPALYDEIARVLMEPQSPAQAVESHGEELR